MELTIQLKMAGLWKLMELDAGDILKELAERYGRENVEETIVKAGLSHLLLNEFYEVIKETVPCGTGEKERD